VGGKKATRFNLLHIFFLSIQENGSSSIARRLDQGKGRIWGCIKKVGVFIRIMSNVS